MDLMINGHCVRAYSGPAPNHTCSNWRPTVATICLPVPGTIYSVVGVSNAASCDDAKNHSYLAFVSEGSDTGCRL